MALVLEKHVGKGNGQKKGEMCRTAGLPSVRGQG